MLIAEIVESGFNITKKKAAIVQLVVCVVLIASALVFTDFFVTLSIIIAILYPLYLFYRFCIDSIFNSLRILNVTL